MATISHASDPPATTLSSLGVLVLALGALDFGLEQSIVIPALPALAQHYGASLIAVGWLVTGFLLASVVSVPLLGRLGDMYGKRRLLFVSLGTFAAGAFVCAITDSIELAIAGRIVQGIGAAVGPLTYGLARDTVAPERMSRAVGTVVGAATAGGAVGFLLSGLLVDYVSVAAIFWFLFVIAILLTGAIAALVRETPLRARVPIDVAGSVLLALGLMAALLAISKGREWQWSSARTIGLFVAAAALLGVFVAVERRVQSPLVDMALVTRRPLANANVCACLFGFSFFFAVFLVPLIAASPVETGYGLGLETTSIGLILLPTGLASAVGGSVGGRTVERLGPRTVVVAGSAVGGVAYLSLTFAHSTWFALTAGSAMLGFAWGLILTGIYLVTIRGVGKDKTSVAIAVNVVGRNTSSALGTQIAFVVITAAGVAVESGYNRVFVIGAMGAGITLLSAVLLPGRAALRPLNPST